MKIPPLQPETVATLPMPVVVAGDIHLAPTYPEVREAFLSFVARRAEAGGTLVLLGDLFDYWCGEPQAEDPFLVPVFEALRDATRAGLHLVFQAGNRDFAFEGLPDLDIDLWSEVVRTEIDGRDVLLTHGDLLCTSDTGYQRLRKILRRRGGAARTWCRLLPYRLARYLAEGVRGTSARATRRKSRAYMDIDYHAARAWLESADADVLVAGHVHTGVHHRLPARNGAAETPGQELPSREIPAREILVLKDWERGGGVVVFDGGPPRLVAPTRV